MHLHECVCLYFSQSVKTKLRKVGQKHFAPMEFKSLLIWFSLFDRSSI